MASRKTANDFIIKGQNSQTASQVKMYNTVQKFDKPDTRDTNTLRN